jgi:hypothetical protein
LTFPTHSLRLRAPVLFTACSSTAGKANNSIQSPLG